MARPRIHSLETKEAWMRERMARRQQTALAERGQSAPPPKRGTSLSGVERQQREVPSRFLMYEVSEVARWFGVSAETIRQWFGDRAMVVGEKISHPGKRRRRIFRISQQDIDDFIREHRGA